MKVNGNARINLIYMTIAADVQKVLAVAYLSVSIAGLQRVRIPQEHSYQRSDWRSC